MKSVVLVQQTIQILATAFENGSTQDFQLFKESKTAMEDQALCLADAGYRLADIHTNSKTHKAVKASYADI